MILRYSGHLRAWCEGAGETSRHPCRRTKRAQRTPTWYTTVYRTTSEQREGRRVGPTKVRRGRRQTVAPRSTFFEGTRTKGSAPLLCNNQRNRRMLIYDKGRRCAMTSTTAPTTYQTHRRGGHHLLNAESHIAVTPFSPAPCALSTVAIVPIWRRGIGTGPFELVRAHV